MSKDIKIIKLDKKGIHEYQQNRYPYLMIDYAEKIIPGKIANGYKDIIDDFFLDVHWPGDPNMPGMLQIEALVQMGALSILTLPGNKGKIAYLISADKLKFQKKIVSGDRMNIFTEVKSFKRGICEMKGYATVNEKIACKAEFRIILPDIIKDYKIR